MQLDRDTKESLSAAGASAARHLAREGLMTGFSPAFRHLETGEVRLCRMRDGRLSREHLLDGLPDHWVLDRDSRGRPAALASEIEPGFLRGIEFWTLDDFTHPALDA
jgi:hypothetical protein